MPSEAVKVMVRCRPYNEREMKLNCKSCVQLEQKGNQVTLFKENNQQENSKVFTYDAVFA